MKLKKIIVLSIIIVMLLIPFSCYAMTHDEFFNTYDFEYKYMVKYSDNVTNYFSCEYPVNFSMSKYNSKGEKLKSGNSMVMRNEGTLYQLKGSGAVATHTTGGTYIMHDKDNLIGFEYVDVYRRSGDGFFLPIDMKLSPFRQIIVGLIPLVGLIVLALSLRKAWEFLRVQLTM